MPSVRYFNQTAPFWDFVANLEDQGTSHPFFGNNNRGEASENEHEGSNPWAQGWAGFPWGPFAHRGRPGQHPHPPPPPHNEAPTSSPPAPEGESDPEAGPSDDAQRERGAHRHGRRDHHHRGHGPWRGHPGMGGRGGHFGRGHGRRGFHPYAMGPFGGLADMFQNQFFPGNNTGADENGNNENNEFTPEIDVFDAAEAFVVHVSLPGAKKEDVAVSWDAEKSELAITGVAHRPGDEELLKTLALNERKVGAFERKVRLGSRANPAQVEADHITARMEDGVLRVEVPKLDAGYVEVKKVDIE